jgi:peptidoglycan/LPS O-acetylase OafA/YrhL
MSSGNGDQHIPALDGLRGFAMLLVLWFHLRPEQMPGGLVGMTIFFPLSAFLITRMTAREVERTRRIDLRRFYVRRARRLLPAVVVMLVVMSCLLWATGQWTHEIRDEMLSSLLYVNNWWQIANTVDYWNRFGPASPFEHLWSLSVEEQFYIVWPLVVLVTARAGRRPLAALLAVASGILVFSAGYGLWLGIRGADSSFIYYNTLVRSAELMVGSCLALLAALRPISTWPTAVQRAMHAAATPIVLVALLLALSVRDPGTWIVPYGGMVLIALGAAVVLASIVEGGPVCRVLTWTPLIWVGVRCYSMYLWHWPIIVLVTPRTSGLDGWWLTSLQLGMTLAVTVLSYEIIETPFRRGRSAGEGPSAHVSPGRFGTTGEVVHRVIHADDVVGDEIAHAGRDDTFEHLAEHHRLR